MDKSEAEKLLQFNDELALIRTRLANERTFLAYLRTFIGVFAAAVGLIKFTEEIFFVYTGFLLIAAAFIVLIVGIIRFVLGRKLLAVAILKKIEEFHDQTDDNEEQF